MKNKAQTEMRIVINNHLTTTTDDFNFKNQSSNGCHKNSFRRATENQIAIALRLFGSLLRLRLYKMYYFHSPTTLTIHVPSCQGLVARWDAPVNPNNRTHAWNTAVTIL